jgi:RNase P/RNase MRP subunit POP5
MTVRDKAGRRRFILFEVAGETTSGMGRVINLFRQRLPEAGLDGREIRFRVIHFENGIGIVRCSHLVRDQVTEMINSTLLTGTELRTIRTSGTLKTLKDWLRDNRGIKVPGKTIQKKMKNQPNMNSPTPHSQRP